MKFLPQVHFNPNLGGERKEGKGGMGGGVGWEGEQ